MKPLIGVVLLMIGALTAGAWFQFNPAMLIFAILGFGVYRVSRSDVPSIPPRGGTTHWGSGHGIYFDSRDTGVSGQEPNDRGRDGGAGPPP